MINYFIWY